MQPVRSRSNAGFSLIELLAVILIVGILSVALLTAVFDAEEGFEISATRVKLGLAGAALDSYSNDVGDFPPSSFAANVGDTNEVNVGVEALVVALWSNDREAGGHLSADGLVNTDGDASAHRLTDFGTNGLMEISDDWGNPVAYFHRRDYGRDDTYATRDPASGADTTGRVTAAVNETLGRYRAHTGFQLVSAGPDGAFGTDDDIGNTER